MIDYMLQSLAWSLVGLFTGIPLGQMLERVHERRGRGRTPRC